jgi:hypothetical protein
MFERVKAKDCDMGRMKCKACSRSLAAAKFIASMYLFMLLGIFLVGSVGCRSILATGIYMWNGGNVAPAEFEGLEEQRVVVLCRPPASYEFRNAGAARTIGANVASLLAEKVKKIDVVSPGEVDNWIDEQDWDNYKDLGHAVKATRIVYIELDDFDLYRGKTLYQGRSDITITVYDLTDRDKEVFKRHLGQVLFPQNSGIPAADKPVQAFERQYCQVLSKRIAEYFYRHDPNAAYALDAMANN